jgi:hypothetical protein
MSFRTSKLEMDGLLDCLKYVGDVAHIVCYFSVLSSLVADSAGDLCAVQTPNFSMPQHPSTLVHNNVNVLQCIYCSQSSN